MSNATHSPRPLNVWPEHDSGKWIVSRTNLGTNTETVVGEFWHHKDAETFAAAPDLLAALEAMLLVGSLEYCETRPEVHNRARAAIARAKGQT